MIKKLSKLSILNRIIIIGVIFYLWIKTANFINVFKGNKGLIISTLVLALLAFLFLILIPDNRNEK